MLCYAMLCLYFMISVLKVTLIRSKIQSIDDGKKDIWKISSQSMVSVSDEQVAELSARLELISSRTNKNAEEIRGFLKDLSAENEALNKKYRSDNSSACMRIRLVQADALIRKFTNSIGAFESTENSIQSKSRELLVRRFQIVQPEIETDELIKSLGDGNDLGTINNVFAFAASTGGSSQELEKKLEHFRAQQRSMHRLERNILNLNKMFLDMQNLVLAQEENLDHIEVYTQHTVQYQKATNVEKALEYQKNIRKVNFDLLWLFLDFLYFYRLDAVLFDWLIDWLNLKEASKLSTQ